MNDFEIFSWKERITSEVYFVVFAGPYEDGFEYVDTQFRLLREDFVKPLRDGIRAFLSTPAESRRRDLKGQSVRFYFGVSGRGRVASRSNRVGFVHGLAHVIMHEFHEY